MIASRHRRRRGYASGLDSALFHTKISCLCFPRNEVLGLAKRKHSLAEGGSHIEGKAMTINTHKYFSPTNRTNGHKLYLITITYKHYCADELKSTDVTELRLLLLSRSVFT